MLATSKITKFVNQVQNSKVYSPDAIGKAISKLGFNLDPFSTGKLRGIRVNKSDIIRLKKTFNKLIYSTEISDAA